MLHYVNKNYHMLRLAQKQQCSLELYNGTIISNKPSITAFFIIPLFVTIKLVPLN
jgi:hypothetical protein